MINIDCIFDSSQSIESGMCLEDTYTDINKLQTEEKLSMCKKIAIQEYSYEGIVGKAVVGAGTLAVKAAGGIVKFVLHILKAILKLIGKCVKFLLKMVGGVLRSIIHELTKPKKKKPSKEEKDKFKKRLKSDLQSQESYNIYGLEDENQNNEQKKGDPIKNIGKLIHSTYASIKEKVNSTKDSYLMNYLYKLYDRNSDINSEAQKVIQKLNTDKEALKVQQILLTEITSGIKSGVESDKIRSKTNDMLMNFKKKLHLGIDNRIQFHDPNVFYENMINLIYDDNRAVAEAKALKVLQSFSDENTNILKEWHKKSEEAAKMIESFDEKTLDKYKDHNALNNYKACINMFSRYCMSYVNTVKSLVGYTKGHAKILAMMNNYFDQSIA